MHFTSIYKAIMSRPFILLALSLLPLSATAQEAPDQVLQRLAAMGQGVHDVKSEKGRLKSLKVVGQAPISTVLGVAHGLQTAQTKASLKARAAFVEWMASHVTYISQTSNETVAILEGNGNARTEQEKSTSSVKETVIQQATGLVKGLVLVGKDQDPESGILTLVYTWSPERAALAGEAQGTAAGAPSPLPPAPPAANPSPPAATASKPSTDSFPKRALASPEIKE